MTARDVVEAFGELGTRAEELKEHCAVHSAKRVEDLVDMRGVSLSILGPGSPCVHVPLGRANSHRASVTTTITFLNWNGALFPKICPRRRNRARMTKL